MSITLSNIENLAPDQASLKAASKLIKPAKWPLMAKDVDAGAFIWGECQGSGANPYRVVVDSHDHGYKCSCPSRKFPCKHALALMWMYAENKELFVEDKIPDWVNDWVSRRRKRGKGNDPIQQKGAKNINVASTGEPPKPMDEKAEARKKRAAEKRLKNKKASIYAATEELESWLRDQLENGISNLRKEMTQKCRKIAARMVDGKAGALASRLDELPSRILELPKTLQIDALLCELGQMKLLISAWRNNQEDPELMRFVSNSENRETLLENPKVLKIKAIWEVLNEQIKSRRDGLVEQATWLFRITGSEGPHFALLLDYFPASMGKRSQSFTSGDQFEATLAFYPARYLQRAVLVERTQKLEVLKDWPKVDSETPTMNSFRKQFSLTPWIFYYPIQLGEGRLIKDEHKNVWWSPKDDQEVLLVEDDTVGRVAFGLEFYAMTALWDGFRLRPLAAHCQLGRIAFND